MISTLSTVSINTLHGLVWSQMTSLVGCAAKSYSIDRIGRKLCLVILATREPKSRPPLLLTLQAVRTLARNLMSIPASNCLHKMRLEQSWFLLLYCIAQR